MSLQLLCTCSQCVHYCWTPFNFFAWRQLGQRKLGHWQLLQALCDRSIPSNTTLFLKPIQVGPAIISLADSSPSDTLSLDHQQWLANHSWSSNFWIRKCLESIQWAGVLMSKSFEDFRHSVQQVPRIFGCCPFLKDSICSMSLPPSSAWNSGTL